MRDLKKGVKEAQDKLKVILKLVSHLLVIADHFMKENILFKRKMYPNFPGLSEIPGLPVQVLIYSNIIVIIDLTISQKSNLTSPNLS